MFSSLFVCSPFCLISPLSFIQNDRVAHDRRRVPRDKHLESIEHLHLHFPAESLQASLQKNQRELFIFDVFLRFPRRHGLRNGPDGQRALPIWRHHPHTDSHLHSRNSNNHFRDKFIEGKLFEMQISIFGSLLDSLMKKLDVKAKPEQVSSGLFDNEPNNICTQIKKGLIKLHEKYLWRLLTREESDRDEEIHAALEEGLRSRSNSNPKQPYHSIVTLHFIL